eukprot:3332475-Pleurochrysis_carterae.AAC.1
MHVMDNCMVTRYACVRNLEEQLKCRARVIWQLCNPHNTSIREKDNAISARKHAKLASVHCTGRFLSCCLSAHHRTGCLSDSMLRH